MAMSRFVAVVAASSVISAEAGLHVKNWFKYPDYTGDLKVDGGLQIGQTQGNMLVLEYQLMNVDKGCTGTSNGKANTCGIHVHAGTTCTADADVGGHFYEGATDPWGAVQYAADSSTGVTAGRNRVVMAGTTLMKNKGKAFVVHDVNGVRIACGLLEEDVVTAGTSPMYADKFAVYPGYSGTLKVAGSVTMKDTTYQYHQTMPPQGLMMEYTFTGTDVSCKDGADIAKANSCGIHVHEGNCSNAGGHYWDSAGITADPWANVIYIPDANGATKGSIAGVVHTGKTVSTFKDRSFVVHDRTGQRVGCSDISATASTPLNVGGTTMTTLSGLVMLVASVFGFAA